MCDSQCTLCFSELQPNGKCPVCSLRASRNNHGRAYKRHQRRRIIAKRQYIYFHVFNFSKWEWYSRKNGYEYLESEYSKQPGRLAKYNFSCNCGMCKGEKHFSIPSCKDIIANDIFKSQLNDVDLD